MIYAEVARCNDIAAGDATITPERNGIYINPIEHWCEHANYVEKYGEEDARRICNWAKSKAPLDPRKDEPLPNWVVDVLRLGRIGYKGRIRIVMMHAEDILKFKMMSQKGEEK